MFMKLPTRVMERCEMLKMIFITHSYIYSRGLPEAVLVFDYHFTILCHSA